MSFNQWMRQIHRWLADPAGLFNASLDAGTRRAIDIREGDEIDPDAFKALIGEAVAVNLAGKVE